jgi:outer membrane receptor protein involved in Fe transport
MMVMNRNVLRSHGKLAAVSRALILLACAAVPVSSLSVSVAYADGNADEADLQFEAGAEAYSKGDFRTALEHFLASNRLVPNRNVVFNVARTFEQLKRFADAHRYYIDALQGETNLQTIASVQDAIKRIAPNVAVLRIESDPPGATVYIERKDLGSRGRAPRPLAIAEGKYRVIAELDGYEPATIEGVQAKLGSEVLVPFKLKRIVGTVVVSIEGAPKAEVHLDDESSPSMCTAPCTFDAPPGTHFVYFSADGFQAVPRQINVVAKETVKTAAILAPLTGSLVVQADERDAIVEIDGKSMGFTPTVLQNVPAGKRKVLVTLRGYSPAERDVVITPNQQTQLLDLKLVPLRQVAAASRFTENIDDAPSSVTVIDGQELRAFGYPTVAEALRGTRGIALSYDRVYASAAIRGLGDPRDYNNRLLVLQDGTVMNDNIIAASFIGSDGRADLEDVDRIEIVRGPGSLVYGTGAMSGVVNLVPRGKEEENSVQVGAGTYENSVMHARAGFHLNFNKSKSAGVAGSVSGARSDGIDLNVEPRSAPGTTVTAHQVDFFRSIGTAGRFWAGPVTAQWFFHSRDQRVTTGPYGIQFDDARVSYKDERLMGEVRVEPKISETFQILARVYAQHYSYHGAYYYAPVPAPGYDEEYSGTWVGAETRGVITPTRSLRFTLGGEVQGDPEANMAGCGNYAGNNNKCPPVQLDKSGAIIGDSYLDVRQSYVTGAVYGLADWEAAKWVRLSAGVRGDFSSLLAPQIVARGAIILKPWSGGVIKIMGGNAFRRPSIFERFYFDGGTAFLQAEDPTGKNKGAPYVAGGLKAETITNGELELSQRFLEDWVALVSGHLNRIENVITSFQVDPTTGVPTPGSSLVQYQNSRAPALNVGFDVEMRRDWRQGWMVSAFYGYQRPQFVGLDETNPVVVANPGLLKNPRLTNAPEHLAGLRGVVPIVPELASLGVRVTLEGPRRVTYSDNPATKVDESAELTKVKFVGDVTLSGNVRKFGVGYTIGVYNVADVKYNLPITETYFSRLSPQNGRTFLANINVTYP